MQQRPDVRDLPLPEIPKLYDEGTVPKPKKFDAKKGVRRLARERVGTVPAARVIEPKPRRKKPKHKKPPEAEALDS